MKNYLAKNWKHITAAVLVIVLQILSGAGIITPVEANTASAVAGAIGLSLTTNDGTSATPGE